MKSKTDIRFFCFPTVRSFFESWGLYPIEENTGDPELNPGAGINKRCYEKMFEQSHGYIRSSEHGSFFSLFIEMQVARDETLHYVLLATTWAQLEEDWEEYFSDL